MTAYDDLRTEISARYQNLSNRLQQIARFALDDPDAMALETIAMIRFAKTFGFDGFSGMQRIFRSRLVDRTPRYRERIRDLQKCADQSMQTAEGVLSHFVESGVNALGHLLEEISREGLEKAVQLLESAKTIHIVGQRRSFPTAAYLFYGISELGCRCQLIDNIGGMVDQQSQQIARSDVLIAISFPPYGIETLNVVDRTVQRAVPVIAITDSAVSPLHSVAAVSFEVEEATVNGFRSLSATMCLAASLVVRLGQVLEMPTN